MVGIITMSRNLAMTRSPRALSGFCLELKVEKHHVSMSFDGSATSFKQNMARAKLNKSEMTGDSTQRRGLSLPCSFVRGKRLSELCTFGIGGPADYFVEVHDESEMSAVIRVGSGYSFNVLGVQTCNDGFSGLEFATGIPGTVGGAIFMNASASGQETANVLASVEVLCDDGERLIHRKDDSSLVYGYRASPYQSMSGFVAILAATFHLNPCADASQRYRKFVERRRRTQPVGAKSAGCVFRNPGFDLSAGALIEQSGLKGLTVGRAKVSDLHANFLVNAGGSNAAEMRTLIQLVKDGVKRETGMDLKEEIVYVPYQLH